MIVKHLVAVIKGVEVWVILKGTSSPADPHDILAISIEGYVFGILEDYPDIIDDEHPWIIK